MGLPINRRTKAGGKSQLRPVWVRTKCKTRRDFTRLIKVFHGNEMSLRSSLVCTAGNGLSESYTRPRRITGWMLPEGLNSTGIYQRYGGRKHEWLQGVGLLDKASIRNKTRRSYKPGQNCIWNYMTEYVDTLSDSICHFPPKLQAVWIYWKEVNMHATGW